MAETPEIGAVLYCDGGVRPAPNGYAGYGIHGYTYDLTKEVKGELEQAKTGKPKPTQYGYFDDKLKFPKDIKLVHATQYIDVMQGLGYGPTNNQAELRAAADAAERALKLGAKSVKLLTDSQYVIKGLTEYVPTWIKNNWHNSQGQPIKNGDDWKRLISSRDAVLEADVKFSIEYVPGHSDNPGNDLADCMATRGVYLSRNEKDGAAMQYDWVRDATGYWNKKRDISPFFTHPRAYFTTNHQSFMSEDGRHVYYTGNTDHDSKGRLILGKRISDCAYSVMFLKEPEPVLETLRTYAEEKLERGSGAAVYIALLDACFSARHYQDLLECKCDFTMRPSHGGKSVHIPLGGQKTEQIIEATNPPHLIWRAISSLDSLREMLVKWLNRDKAECHLITTDITDQIFSVKEDKKKKPTTVLNPKITPVVKSLKVDVDYEVITGKPGKASCVLTLGLDLPSSQKLGRLAALDTKVYAITYRESEKAFRVATIIETADDVGIWANVYSNPRFVLE